MTAMPDEIVLPAAPSSVPAARRFATDRLGRCGFTDAAPAVEQILSEIVTHAVTHGRAPVTLRLRIMPEHVRVEVVESGVVPAPRPAGSPAARSLGMRLVDRLSSAWGVDTLAAGSVVWFVVPRHPEVSADDATIAAQPERP